MVEGFKWILPGVLAGSGRPGLLGDLDTDIEYLRSAGIELVISLTQEPLSLPEGCTLKVHHFPIPDMGISTPRKTRELCDFIFDAIDRKQSVLVHCKAGLGRTGTVLACALVSRGSKPDHAIQRLRRLTPYYIQSQVQEKFVEHYAAFLFKTQSLENQITPQGAHKAGALGVGVLLTDRLGNISFANRTAEKLLGAWPNNLTSTKISEHFDADWLAKAMTLEAPREHESRPARLITASSPRDQLHLSTYRVQLGPSTPPSFIVLLEANGNTRTQ